MHVPFGPPELEQLPNLRVVSNHGVGYGHIDAEYLLGRGVAARRVALARRARLRITFFARPIRIRPGGLTVPTACPEGVEVSYGVCWGRDIGR